MIDHGQKALDPFRAYIGKHVLLRHAPHKIVRSEVHGRELRFVAACVDSGTEVMIRVSDLLDQELAEA